MSQSKQSRQRFTGSRRDIRDLLLVFLGGGIVHLAAIHFDLFDYLYRLANRRQELQLEALFAVSIYLVIVLAIFSWRRWGEAMAAQGVLEIKNRELERAMAEIRQLRGILPICASCKKIRDEKGSWHSVELYVQRNSDAEFTHSICPDCRKHLYPEFPLEEEETA